MVVEGVGTLATNHIKNLVQNTDKNKRNLRSGGWREPQQAVLSRVSPVRQRSLQPCQSPCPSDSPAKMKQNPCQAFKAEPNSARKGNLKSTEETFQVWSGQVTQILRGYPSGASQEQVEEIFESQYRSKLPHIWTRALTKAGLIDVDTENKVNTKPLLFLATDILTEEVIPTVRPIRKEWDVLVNAVDSKRQEAWVTLQDEASLQIRQQLRMKLRLQLESLREEILHPGQYLSGRVQQGEVERLQVVKVNRLNQTCRCFLLDVGTEVELSWSSLSPLQQDCRNTPAQAVKVRLAGFNKYTNSQFAEFVMDKLVGKRFVARDVGFSISNIPELRIFDDHEKSEVQFVDEAVTKMKELRLDGLDRQRQEQDGVGPQLQTPILPEEGDFIDCKVTRVVSAGEIWVQNCSAVRQYDVMKRSLTAFYTLGNGRAVLNPQDGSIVAVRVGKDWFRAKIIFKMRAAFPAGKVAHKMLVKLVDTGKVLLVKLSQMRSLEKCFAELPVQVTSKAIKSSVVISDVRLSW